MIIILTKSYPLFLLIMHDRCPGYSHPIQKMKLFHCICISMLSVFLSIINLKAQSIPHLPEEIKKIMTDCSASISGSKWIKSSASGGNPWVRCQYKRSVCLFSLWLVPLYLWHNTTLLSIWLNADNELGITLM